MSLAWLFAIALGLPVPDLMRDEICAGCFAAGKERGGPQPLVVVLHGDEGSPTNVAGVWSPLAERGVCPGPNGAARACEPRDAASDQQNFWVFAPKCPTSEGCAGSYWRWGGEVAWLGAQVDAFSRKHAVDPARIYLAGWSGGATYIAMKNPEWFPRFAALSLAGGGTHPHTEACFPNAGGACAPVTYLMGSGNPLFALAEEARQGFERCGHALDYQLLAGVDHAGEWRAYKMRVAGIASWLLSQREGCKQLADRSAPNASLPPSNAPPSASGAQASPPAPPSTLPPGTGCACQSAANTGAPSAATGLACLFAVLRFSRFGARRVERRLANPRRSRP